MAAAPLQAAGSPRRRKRKTRLPQSSLIIDIVCLVMLTLMPAAVIWIFGGNRFWVMGPAILLILFTGLLFVYRFVWSYGRADLAIPPGGLVFLVFLVYLAVSIPRAEIPYEAWLGFLRFVSYAAVYWMWFNLLRINKRWKWILALVLLSVSVMAWYALIQDVHGTNMVLNRERPEQYGMRASGAYICPNHFANLMAMTIPVSVAVAMYRNGGFALRLIAGYTALICLPALYLTESRSGYIGLITAGVVMTLVVALRSGMKRFLLMLVVAPLVAATLAGTVWMASPRIQARVTAAIQGDIRIPLWKDSIVISREKPVLGNGLGSYYWMYPHYRVHYTDNANPEFAHNDHLQFWGEIGAVGMIFPVLIILLVVRRALRIVRHPDSRHDAVLMGGLLGCMAGAYAHAFFDFNFHIFGNVQFMLFLVAIMLAAVYDKSQDPVLPVRNVPTRAVSAVMAAALILIGLTYTRDVVSYFHVLKSGALVEKLKWDEAQAGYEKAVAWAPRNFRAHTGLANLLRTRGFWVRNRELRMEWLEKARVHYERAGALNPWEADVDHGLATVYKLEGREEDALRMFRQAVARVPRQTFYLNELGMMLRTMKRYEEALEVFEESRAVEKTPVAERNIEWLKRRVSGGPA